MKFKVMLAAAVAIAVSVPALAKDDGQSGGDAPKEKKICRTETATGSLVAKRRICLTQAEWDDMAANARKNLSDYSRRQGIGAETGSGSGANNTAGF